MRRAPGVTFNARGSGVLPLETTSRRALEAAALVPSGRAGFFRCEWRCKGARLSFQSWGAALSPRASLELPRGTLTKAPT